MVVDAQVGRFQHPRPISPLIRELLVYSWNYFTSMAFNDLINDMIHFINEGFPMCTFAYRFNYPHSHLVVTVIRSDQRDERRFCRGLLFVWEVYAACISECMCVYAGLTGIEIAAASLWWQRMRFLWGDWTQFILDNKKKWAFAFLILALFIPISYFFPFLCLPL